MLLPALSAVVFLFILSGSLWSARHARSTFEAIQDEFEAYLRLGHELEIIVVRMPHLLQSAITAGDMDMLLDADTLHDDFHDLMDRAAELKGVTRAEIDSTIVMFDDYYAVARSATSLMIESDLNVPTDVYLQLNRMRELHEIIQKRSTDKSVEIQGRLQGTMERARQQAGQTMSVIIAVAIGVLLLSVLISVGSVASIIRPLGSMRNSAEAIAQGDLHMPLDYRSDDDLGRLADAFRGMQGSLIRDIARREEAESKLRASEERLSEAFDAANEGLWDLDIKRDSLYYSPRYAEILGYDMDELPSSVTEMRKQIHPEDQNLVDSGFQSHLDHGFPFDVETRLQHKDGRWAWVHMRAKIVSRDKKGVPVRMVGTIADIQVRKAAEEELIRLTQDLEKALKDLRATQSRLIQSEKMASLGQLVAGISHELNNPIGAVTSSIDVMERAIVKLEDAMNRSQACDAVRETPGYVRALDIMKESLSNTDRASQRIIDLVSGLKRFSHLDEADLQQVDLVQGLESTLSVVAHELGDRIKVVRQYGELPRITCYPGEVNHVFLNILTNSVKAIDGQGTITILTEAMDEGVAEGVRVRITDTGCGMTEKQIAGVFDMGFSGDASRVKMQWGLVTSYRIVQRHKGNIHIDSELDVGTTVTVELPLFLS
jgi:PAS domain S-box-containing protein